MPNVRRHLSSACFYLNKLSFGKTFKCKVERLNVKQRRFRLSRLIWIYTVCKSILLSPVAVKELKKLHSSASNSDCNLYIHNGKILCQTGHLPLVYFPFRLKKCLFCIYVWCLTITVSLVWELVLSIRISLTKRRLTT